MYTGSENCVYLPIGSPYILPSVISLPYNLPKRNNFSLSVNTISILVGRKSAWNSESRLFSLQVSNWCCIFFECIDPAWGMLEVGKKKRTIKGHAVYQTFSWLQNPPYTRGVYTVIWFHFASRCHSLNKAHHVATHWTRQRIMCKPNFLCKLTNKSHKFFKKNYRCTSLPTLALYKILNSSSSYINKYKNRLLRYKKRFLSSLFLFNIMIHSSPVFSKKNKMQKSENYIIFFFFLYF
jgi:hypothetical protein